MSGNISRRIIVVGVLALPLLSGCHHEQESYPIHLRNPLTGDIMTCGPFPIDLADKEALVRQENACRERAKRLGYDQPA